MYVRTPVTLVCLEGRPSVLVDKFWDWNWISPDCSVLNTFQFTVRRYMEPNLWYKSRYGVGHKWHHFPKWEGVVMMCDEGGRGFEVSERHNSLNVTSIVLCRADYNSHTAVRQFASCWWMDSRRPAVTASSRPKVSTLFVRMFCISKIVRADPSGRAV
jgi:hypothetical protein